MICRVCKRELDSPVCSFCGEDNTPYMNQEDSLVNNSDGILDESSVEPEDKPIEEKKKIVRSAVEKIVITDNTVDVYYTFETV